MSNNLNQPFYKAGRVYVQKLIRMRSAMIRKGVDTGLYSQPIIDELGGLLKFWPYSSNETMAQFINNKSLQIMYLIPGPNCRAHKSLNEEFNSLYDKSREILNYAAVC
jgi:hypothetical protein